MPVIIVGPYTFRSKKELGEFEKETMAHLDYTDSLRATASEDVFAFYVALVHRHPEVSRKLEKGLADLKIVRSKRDYHAKELQIIHHDGDWSSISRNTCVTQRADTDHGRLRAAMRTAIDGQTTTYRARHSRCERCDVSTPSGEVDHILPFETLVSNFCAGRSDIPTEFSKMPLTNQVCFASPGFSAEWQQYHLDNATLRYLCQTCHKNRSAWEAKT